jgi:hypothetical protein
MNGLAPLCIERRISMKKIIAMMVCLLMVLSVSALAERGGFGGPGGERF